MGKTRDHLEAGRGGSSHIRNFIQSSGAVVAIIWSGDVGAINGHGETIIRGKNGFLTTGDGKRTKRSLGRIWIQEE